MAYHVAMLSLDQLKFENHFATLPEDFFSRVNPTPLNNPFLISYNSEAGELIDLDPEEAQREEFVAAFSGNQRLAGSDPLAMLYSGHQFGHYNPQLGDGRAILLGQVSGWELQLKGSGQTPYSRGADGRAVLRSTIREYLCSAAMQGLGIPTTQALCIIGSDEEVCRETIETGAMLVRMAPSHIRFGSFEIFYHRQQFKQLKQLADFTLEHDYPELLGDDEPYLSLLQTITTRTATLIAQWQLVGFSHGVMNTDNMSILGLTLDYGPFGFLDNYDPRFICNHSDHQGRYAFGQQPAIGLWNLNQLAQALLPLIDQGDDLPAAVDKAKQVLQSYQTTFSDVYINGMRAKLGLKTQQQNDQPFIQNSLDLLEANQVDFTLFFRNLSQLQSEQPENDQVIRDLFIDRDSFDRWAVQYRERLQQEDSEDKTRQQAMNQVNPKYILRNYLAQQAIEKAQQGDYSDIDLLLKLLRNPFDNQHDMQQYADQPPEWAKEISVSCSS